LAEAVWLTELVLARVNVTISENVCALAVLETVAPFSLISVSIFPFVDTISVSFGRSPLTDIRITKNTFPDTLAFLQASSPFAFVVFSVGPSVEAVPMGFITYKFSFVFISV